MNVNGMDYDEKIGWYDINEAYCANGCKKPVAGDGTLDFYPLSHDDFDVITELLCKDCLQNT